MVITEFDVHVDDLQSGKFATLGAPDLSQQPIQRHKGYDIEDNIRERQQNMASRV
jgi:hypothetical protein